ncbi:MAG: flagellar biosynthetic protein FliR [Myxococcales bacterium]|nr:flagellar biosynthetic protein FliR [Myxococcales bacterium]
MPLVTLPLPLIELFALVYLRLMGFILTAPVFSSTEIPTKIQAGLGFGLALILTMAVSQDPQSLPELGLSFFFALVREFLLGIISGFLISWVVEGVVIGMQMVGFQMGFSIVNTIDPTTGSSISILASFQVRLALLVFLVGGMYRHFLEAVAASYRIVPIGAAVFSPGQGQSIIDTVGLALRISIVLAATPIVSLMLVKIGLGILARTVPQMNVFVVGFPLTIGAGLLATAVVIPQFIIGVDHLFGQSLDRMILFWRSAAP